MVTGAQLVAAAVPRAGPPFWVKAMHVDFVSIFDARLGLFYIKESRCVCAGGLLLLCWPCSLESYRSPAVAAVRPVEARLHRLGMLLWFVRRRRSRLGGPLPARRL